MVPARAIMRLFPDSPSDMCNQYQSAPEPTWINLSRLRGTLLPTQLNPWLRESGSLTRAVVRACDGRFRVDLRRQGWGGALYSERRLLQMTPRLSALLREVKLLCDEQPWVFARTLIPATSLRGRARRLAHLRNKPLGAVLFADPKTRRLSVEVARLTPRHALFRAACSHLSEMPTELWGRRTLFRYDGQPILVNEIFLPTVPAR
jgi:chorismate lyase